MEKYAIIVAGGSGSRFGAPLPKQYVELSGIPIIIRTLQQVQIVVSTDHIVVVIPEADFGMFREMCNSHNISEPHLAASGATRFLSVKSGLSLLHSIAPNGGLVAIHDGVRPFASPTLFDSGFKVAQKYGAAVPCVPMIDSVRVVNGTETSSLKRENLRCVQTPQVFDILTLVKAYDTEPLPKFTDDASVMEASGKKIAIFDGEIENIKITNPIDQVVAEYYLSRNSK